MNIFKLHKNAGQMSRIDGDRMMTDDAGFHSAAQSVDLGAIRQKILNLSALRPVTTG